jgi:septum formation protein
MHYILASASPRRRELLGLLLPRFTVEAPEADESFENGMPPDKAVTLLAGRKAEAVSARHVQAAVIGADTVVEADGTILGKPRSAADARRMLGFLSGRTHRVHTGVALIYPGGKRTVAESTAVTFAAMSDEEIRRYVSTGEPMDKAGAYGIQGLGGIFIPRIEGDYYNVMGLPLNALYTLLKEEKLL